MKTNSKKVYFFIANSEELSGSLVLLRTLVKKLNSRHVVNHIIFLNGNRSDVFIHNNLLYISDFIGMEYSWPRKFLFLRRRLIELIIHFYVCFKRQKGSDSIMVFNAVTSIYKMGWISNFFNIKKFAWIHESKYLLELHGGILKISANEKLQFIASSYIVKNDLSAFLPGSCSPIIHYIGAAIDDENLNHISLRSKILISGYIDWNKGSDLILPLINLVSIEIPDIIFKIVVSKSNTPSFRQFTSDLARLNLLDRNVELHYSVDNSSLIYNDVKVSLILSRNESLSLVALESLLRKIPFLFFEGSGGPEEILGEESCLSVPFLNLKIMAEKIIDICRNEIHYNEMMNNVELQRKDLYTSDLMLRRFLAVTR